VVDLGRLEAVKVDGADVSEASNYYLQSCTELPVVCDVLTAALPAYMCVGSSEDHWPRFEVPEEQVRGKQRYLYTGK